MGGLHAISIAMDGSLMVVPPGKEGAFSRGVAQFDILWGCHPIALRSSSELFAEPSNDFQ